MIPDEIRQSIVDIIHQEVWKTASLTTAVIVVGGLFIAFITKNWFLNWVQNKVSHEFNQKLEAYKNGLQADLEVFKLATTQAQDRRARSNEKEYDACIECWNSLCEAFWPVRFLCSSITPAIFLSRRSDSDIKYILADFDFNEFETNKVLQAKNRDDAFYKIRKDKELHNASLKIQSLKDTLDKDSIFFGKELYGEFYSLFELIKKAFFEVRYRHQLEVITSTRDSQELIETGEKRLDNIRDILRANLHIRAMEFTHPSQRDALNSPPETQPAPPDNSPIH